MEHRLCLAQQSDAHRSTLTPLTCEATGVPLVAPPVVQPRLMTHDMEAEWKSLADAMDDGIDRVVFVGAEFSADASAFRAANPGAELSDFLRWRARLSIDVRCERGPCLPEGWQGLLWNVAVPKPAVEQASLFHPLLEAEKACELNNGR